MRLMDHVPGHVVSARFSFVASVLVAACAIMCCGGFGIGADGSLVVHKYSTRVVRTKYGPLRGVIVHGHPPVEAFLGVPYATPPLGSLR